MNVTWAYLISMQMYVYIDGQKICIRIVPEFFKILFLFPRCYYWHFLSVLCIPFKGRDSTKMDQGMWQTQNSWEIKFPRLHIDKSWLCPDSSQSGTNILQPVCTGAEKLGRRVALSKENVGPQSEFCSQKIKIFQLSMERELSRNSTMSWKSLPDLPPCSSGGTPWEIQGKSSRSLLGTPGSKSSRSLPCSSQLLRTDKQPWRILAWTSMTGWGDSIPPWSLHELRKEL